MVKTNLSLMLILLLGSVACQKENECGKESLSIFRYDTSTGKCVNCLGEAGYNQVDTIQARQTKNCECMDLSNQEVALLKEGVTMENLLHYPELDGYNFRGAKLDSARIFFANIKNSDFKGAKMATLQYGYTTIEGITDNFTQMPNQGECTSTNDSFSCFR